MSEPDDAPAMVTAPGPLTARERRWVLGAAVAPILLAALVLLPVALATGAGAGEVLGGALVYGGLLGLAAAFVAVDRLQARQCPACRRRTGRGEPRCACGYDLLQRPRFTCERRHALFVEGGVCDCGRRLHPLPTARGLGPQVVMSLRIGAWLLAFLLGVGLLLYLLEGRL